MRLREALRNCRFHWDNGDCGFSPGMEPQRVLKVLHYRERRAKASLLETLGCIVESHMIAAVQCKDRKIRFMDCRYNTFSNFPDPNYDVDIVFTFPRTVKLP